MKKILILQIFAIQAMLFAQPCQFTPWSSYGCFYLDDQRSNGNGTVQGSNTLFGFNALFHPRFYSSLYGNYQNSTNKSNQPATSTVAGSNGESKVAGWGVGAGANYLVTPICCPCQTWAYANFLYVWQTQHSNQTTIPTAEAPFSSSDASNTNGNNWQVAGGVNVLLPMRCVNLLSNANYVYIKSATNGFGKGVPQFGGAFISEETVAGSGSTFGIGNVSASVIFLPRIAINPMLLGGISYDIHRSNNPSITYVGTDVSYPSDVALRARFEWNLGAGVSVVKNQLSFTASYLHRQRVGPIVMDLMTLYGSYVF